MGWIGDMDEIHKVLSKENADKDEDDKFILRGRIVTFLGMGEEAVIDEGTTYFVDGKEQLLIPKLKSGMDIKVY